MSGIRIRIDDSKFRTVVLWSGGLDSTIVLHQAALATYSKSDPVIALSIRSHLGGPKNRFNGQTKARENYLKFAKM
jgi:NH3-dependent NAD+ synthetase